jgi:hypothetical protein
VIGRQVLRHSSFLKSSAMALTGNLARVGVAVVPGLAFARATLTHPTLEGEVAILATNMAASFAVEASKDLYRAVWSDRAGRPVDENNVIVRTLRAAQLKALRTTRERFDLSRRTEPDKARREQGDIFSERLGDFLRVEENLVATLTIDSLAEPTEKDVEALRRVAAIPEVKAKRDTVIRRASADLAASLSARHGSGPALNAIRHTAELDILAEISTYMFAEATIAFGEIPPLFLSAFTGPFDGTNGWFALFVREAAAKLRAGGEFEKIWAAEQSAVVRHLVEMAKLKIDNVAAVTSACLTALKTHGEKLDAIAGGRAEIAAMLQDINARLGDDCHWLSIETGVSCDGWLRFTARNPRLPFIGRQPELAKLYDFLYSPETFAWWIATAPGGAGKTRLALELCYRANLAGWRVGFLRKSKPELPVLLPSGSWRPRRPTLIIADYASEQTTFVSSLALRLAELPDDSEYVVRLLMLDRQVDQEFWNRFFGSSSKH